MNGRRLGLLAGLIAIATVLGCTNSAYEARRRPAGKTAPAYTPAPPAPGEYNQPPIPEEVEEPYDEEVLRRAPRPRAKPVAKKPPPKRRAIKTPEPTGGQKVKAVETPAPPSPDAIRRSPVVPAQPASVFKGLEDKEEELREELGRTTDGLERERLENELKQLREEELIVVEKGLWDHWARKGGPEGGQLIALTPKKKLVPLPLKHTDVKAQVSLFVASVTVKQGYHNPYDSKIEAVYVFPLPQNAGVTEFVMTIGKRTIRGIIRERKEAERIYAEARARGYTASLLTQERPNIFTQKVANIEPGKEIDISITYFNTLKYEEGEYEFVFPMVVGPRFNPPNAKDPIRPVASGTPPGRDKQVSYLRPDEISSHYISINLDIMAGLPIRHIESPSHAIGIQRVKADQVRVQLSGEDRIPNRDFVVRWRVDAEEIKSAIAVNKDGYFTLMIQPPKSLKDIGVPSREMVFVLDCSGSMSGFPIETAKRALINALNRLRTKDTFQVIRFSNNASKFGPKPVRASPANVARAVRYVKNLSGGGGTMMIEGIKAALDFPHDPGRFRIVSFMTDGYIGNEAEILGEIHKRLGDSRIFSLGIGSSVNHYLLKRMGKIGRGTTLLVLHDEKADRIVDGFYRYVEHPAMTDIQIDWDGMQVSDVYPWKTRDLFAGRPVIVSGRFKGTGQQTIRVRGKVGGEPIELTVPVDLDRPDMRHKALGSVWARARISELSDRMTYVKHPEELGGEILQTALRHGLMSKYTAFVAVDSSRRTAGDHGTSVGVPVPVPAGVRYDTTVGEK